MYVEIALQHCTLSGLNKQFHTANDLLAWVLGQGLTASHHSYTGLQTLMDSLEWPKQVLFSFNFMMTVLVVNKNCLC